MVQTCAPAVDEPGMRCGKVGALETSRAVEALKAFSLRFWLFAAALLGRCLRLARASPFA